MLWRMIFDMMKIDTYHHFVSDGAEGKLPKWVRVVRFISGLVFGVCDVAFCVLLLWFAFKFIISGLVVLGVVSALVGTAYVAYSILHVVRGTGKLDGFMRDVMDFKYRK